MLVKAKIYQRALCCFIENLHCYMIKHSHQLKQEDDICKTG